MCGIAGIIGIKENAQETMRSMLQLQAHRGPDATEIWKDENCILGHNRLSIIDLSTSANQPMQSHCGRFVIVFNGEIYNYKELKTQVDYPYLSKSDTEVLLALYIAKGREMLSLLNGMFALAIWDKQEKKLFVARDRFGVKPFYFYENESEFIFASEIKTIFAAGVTKEKNEQVWANYLTYGTYGMPNQTFWKNIQQLPAGYFFEYDFNTKKHTQSQWYDFVKNINEQKPITENELKETYLTLVQDSIQLRFRADVPVGFNISGGLDSSALLALVNKAFPNNNDIEAFTFYSNDERYDELPWVEKMIAQTHKPLNKCLLNVSEIERLINEVSYYQDEPYGGFPTLAYSTIFKKAREKGVLVLLDGQGMDEAWAGYDYYQTNSGFTIQGTTTSPVKPEALQKDFLALAEKENYIRPFDNALQNLQYRDIFYTKIPRALRFNDRISMMHSTELREPFLDYRMVELAFAQPNDIKIKDGKSKWMLREIVKKLLGNDIALAPKRPLQTPQREWIANELKDFFQSEIEKFSSNDFVQKKEVEKIWSNYLNGENDNSFFVWQWINTVSLLK